jgi:hypothetical protein
LKFLYAVLVEASRAWRGLSMTLKTLRGPDQFRGEISQEKKLAQRPDGFACAAELSHENGDLIFRAMFARYRHSLKSRK